MKFAQISIARIRTQWSRFAVDRRGAMAMTLGLLMTGFAGMTALSVDVADWYGARRIMQASADAGAMGGAMALKNGNSNSQAISAATTDAQLNATGLASGSAVTASVNASSQVTVTLSKKATLLLSGLFLSSAPTITATATAGLVQMTSNTGTPMCLLVTSPAAANVVVLSGSSSIQASGCRVVVNSSSTSAINLSGNTTINSKSLCGPGGNNVSGSSTLNPGEMPHPSHHHPDEEFLVIRVGTLTVTVNGKPQVLGPGSIAFFASNEEHSVKNTGTTQANYTVFKIRTAATPR